MMTKDLFENPSLEASLEDLKVVYRVLVVHGSEHPELAENAFVTSLDRLLRAQARVEGVDTTDDREWSAWLAGEEAPDEPEGTLLN